jgi:hypothetical protein
MLKTMDTNQISLVIDPIDMILARLARFDVKFARKEIERKHIR